MIVESMLGVVFLGDVVVEVKCLKRQERNIVSL